MPAYCSVSACKITTDHVKTLGIQVSFFSFPRDEETCKQWILKCNRKAAINVKNARVCSLHFAPEDFERDLKSELLNLPRKLKIKRGSVPSLKLDLSSVEKCCNSKIDAVSIKDECKVQTRKRKKLFKSIEDNPKENLAKEQNCQNGQLKKAKLPKVETKKLVTLASKPVIEIVKKSKKITPNLLRSKPNILKTGIKHRNKKEQKNVNSVGNETKSNRAILPSQSNNLIVPLNPAPNLALPRLAPLSSTTVLPVKLSFVQLSSNSDMNELQKLRSTNNHLTYVNEMLRKQLAHIKVELEKSKNEIRSLQVERRRQTNFTRESTKKSPIYTEILNLLRKSFTPAQIKVLLNQKSRIHWKEDDLIRAFTLFYLSKKSYIYLRKHLNYPLPGLSTLQSWSVRMKKKEESSSTFGNNNEPETSIELMKEDSDVEDSIPTTSCAKSCAVVWDKNDNLEDLSTMSGKKINENETEHSYAFSSNGKQILPNSNENKL